jgi:hypothetical protein
MTTKYLVLNSNCYENFEVYHCNSEEDLAGLLRHKQHGVHFSLSMLDIEVFEVTRELKPAELLEIRGATNA